MFKSLSFYFACPFCLVIMNAGAQHLERIGKEKPLEISGGLSLNQVLYTSFGNLSRRDPYSYIASANLNAALYGWSVPLSFTFSNQGRSFQQPFNRYSIHPTYKALQAHIGNVSASYSPYSVNGHNFLGAAIDYEPEGKLKLSGLYGRFLRKVSYDSTAGNTPSYHRIGYGLKVLFLHENNSVQITMFHAEDENQYLGFIPDSLVINPQENLVVSIAGSTVLFSRFVLKAEFASSTVSSNINSPKETREYFIARLGPLYSARASSSFYNAFKANFDYQQQQFTVGLGYERIDPGYKTFGAYFFNSDFENFTVNASTTTLNGKMSVNTSIGIQQDNLDRAQVSTLKRSVGSLNLNYAPSQKVSLSGSYSSFQTFTNVRSQFQDVNQLSPYENIDTLNFTQISRSGSFNCIYAFGSNPERKQSLNLNSSVQGASDMQGDVLQNSGAWFYNVNMAYAVSLQPQTTTMSVSFNAGLNDTGGNRSHMIGPVMSLSRGFFEKKLRTNFSMSHSASLVKGLNSGRTSSMRVGGGLKLKHHHNLNLNVTVLQRTPSSSKAQLEFTSALGYSYNFSSGNKKI